MLIALALLLAQSGPMVSPGAAPSLNLPEIDRPSEAARRRHAHGESSAAPVPAPASASANRLSACLSQAASAPLDAIDTAQDWLKQAQGSAQAAPQLCLGSAYAGLERWAEAEQAFIAGRDLAAANDRLLRARLGAMAGNAILASTASNTAGAKAASERALATLDTARTEAMAGEDNRLQAGIAIDRARALVIQNRTLEAASALADARRAEPDNALAWLLSATLSRRANALADAQAQIETAATLAPRDPEIGLEAGVIAALGGREEAARKSWQSVIAAAPESEPAGRAKAYLAQLDTAAMPTNPPPKKR